jgi:hypothetical protein
MDKEYNGFDLIREDWQEQDEQGTHDDIGGEPRGKYIVTSEEREAFKKELFKKPEPDYFEKNGITFDR